ncbi:hypothetical protein J5N97_002746 [Dioscorea zingiberensis]|uniref:C3H1-type domain-containing protein n=1 Tax=Dioscorea zingiberensis TaxID=325984 RepID=A0A9D5HPH1_9LILI|nr:hypothetical protein J5N97_002746 [Dioscorea zingiberensis]
MEPYDTFHHRSARCSPMSPPPPHPGFIDAPPPFHLHHPPPRHHHRPSDADHAFFNPCAPLPPPPPIRRNRGGDPQFEFDPNWERVHRRPMPPSPIAGVQMGRKRLRWDQDRAFEEELGGSRRGPRRLGFADGHPRRDGFFDQSMPNPSVLSPRDGSWGRLGPNRGVFMADRQEVTAPWGSWNDVRPPPPPPPPAYHGEKVVDGSRSMFVEGSSWRSWDDTPTGHQKEGAIHDSSRVGFGPPSRVEGHWTDERRHLQPPFRNFESMHSGMGEGFAGHGFQEERVLGNKGKRIVLNGRGSRSPTITPTKRLPRKPSALSRIQSGVSVWERIEEKQHPFVSSLHDGVSEEQQPEMDHLDLSYKSNALVAKVLAPPNPVGSSSDGKAIVSRTPKKKVVKKKVLKPREKVVVPVSWSVLTSGALEIVPKKPLVSGSPVKHSNKVSESVVVSSSVVPDLLNASVSGEFKGVPKKSLVSGSPGKLSFKLSEKVVSSSVVPYSSNSQPGPKKVKLMGSAGKSPVKVSAKAKPSVEVQKMEITPCLDTFRSEIKTMVDGSSKVCELTAEMDLVENNVTAQSSKIVCVDELSSFEVIGKDENETLGEKVHGTCADDTGISDAEILNSFHADGNLNTFNSDGEILKDFSLEQGTTGIMLPFADGGVERPAQSIAIVENGISKGPSEELTCMMPDVGNTANFVVGLGKNFNGSHPSTLEDGEQITSPADSLRGKGMGQKDEGEKQHDLEVAVLTEGFEVHEGSVSDACDVVLDSQADGITPPFPFKANEIDSESTQPHGATDGAPSIQVVGEMLQSNHFDLVDAEVVGVTSYADKTTEVLMPSHLSDVDSLIVASDGQDIGCSVDAEQSDSWLSDLKSCNDDKDNDNQEEQPAGRDDSSAVSMRHLVSEAEEVKSDKTMPCHQEISGLPLVGLSYGSTKQIAPVLGVIEEEFTSRKGLAETGITRILPNKGSLAVKEASHSIRNLRNKTWHRTDSTSSASPLHGNLLSGTSRSLAKQSSKKLERVQNSYIRKGNSLIRKSFPVQQPPQPKSVTNGENKVQKLSSKDFEGKTDAANHATSNPFFERPKTPSLLHHINSPSLSANPLQDTHNIPEGLTCEAGFETQDKHPESQIADFVLGSSVDSQSVQSISKSEPFDAKKIRYVKRKSNQLVAAPEPNHVDLSTHYIEKAQKESSFAPSDLYFRKKKNQLVRNASSDLQKHDILIPVDNSNSDDQRIPNILSLKSSTKGPFKKRLDKVLQKKYKHSSLVWTLGGEEMQKKGVSEVSSWKVLPSLFPWKRAIYWKGSSNIPCISNRYPLSLISRSLQLTRKRNTVYTVSTDGFSIRKAGVISIGGSNLKWSKSIERRSKKASEEATLAVAEVERMKRERKRAAHLGSNKKNGNCLLRERIFRVGSARYKMDPSKRTLIRISDDQLSSSADQQGVNRLKSFVPRRLLIGNDEYIRIGNGNKLVRDPKKLIRILASEKVRWSLHTARLKLARKQQYCQFFTRFGKCNKNGGKCPYIHDPTKVAICTKFLKGLCSSTNCKLTHKVQPERMPDCSYFLRGLCTNINCPYRHVNVNPKAVVCEGFLKGYCADGDECCKKHSYVCPVFEATGKCPHGSKCKLHHPKSINKTKKRKQTTVQICSNKRRYFGSSITEAGKPLNVVSYKNDTEEGDMFCCDGRFTDFISLDVKSDEDGTEATVPMDSHSTPCDSELSDQQPDDIDALIKPVGLMHTTNLTIPSTYP